MVYYDDDEVLNEIHDELYQQEEERPKSGFSTLNDNTKFWFMFFLGGIALMVILNKIELKTALMIGGVGAIILFFMSRESPERKELTWIECMIRLYDALEFIQNHPIGKSGSQIPKGNIEVKPIGRKQWYEGRSWKRSFGVDIYDSELNITEHYFSEVDIFTGDVISFRHSPEGVRGDETRDIKIIAGRDLFANKKRDEYSGKAWRK